MKLFEELGKQKQILVGDPLFEAIHEIKAQNEALIQELIMVPRPRKRFAR